MTLRSTNSEGGHYGERYDFSVEVITHDYAADKFTAPEEKKRIDIGVLEATNEGKRFVLEGGDLGDRKNNYGLRLALRTCPQLVRWLPLMRTSMALDALYNPGARQITPAEPRGDDLYNWLCNLDIGIGLRERAVVEVNLLKQAFTEHHRKNNGRTANALILASGSGKYPLTAAVGASVDNGIAEPNLVFMDKDAEALLRTERNAKDSGYGKFEIVEGDILDTEEFKISKIGAGAIRSTDYDAVAFGWHDQKCLPVKYDTVSAIGLMEYLPRLNWEMESAISSFGHKDTDVLYRAGTQQLAQTAWSHVKPGGLFIFSSINLINPNRPNDGELPVIDYLRYAIGWNGLRPTTENDKNGILPMVNESSMNPDFMRIHRSPHGIFNIYELHKPNQSVV
jgi:SAM-dependent methyltransferase